eukprot:c23470_g1_i1 orf=2-430(-)
MYSQKWLLQNTHIATGKDPIYIACNAFTNTLIATDTSCKDKLLFVKINKALASSKLLWLRSLPRSKGRSLRIEVCPLLHIRVPVTSNHILMEEHLNLLNFLLTELDLKCTHILLEVFHFGSTGYRHDIISLMLNPRKGKLTRG